MSVDSDEGNFSFPECRRPFHLLEGEVVRLFARKYPLHYARPPTLGGQALKEILYRTHVIYLDNVSVYIGASKLALHITTDIETGMGRLVVGDVLRSNADAVDGVVQEGVKAIGGG